MSATNPILVTGAAGRIGGVGRAIVPPQEGDQRP